MREFTHKTPETVRGGATDRWVLCDSPTELASLPLSRDSEVGGSWSGGNGSQARQWAREGRMEDVVGSDKMLDAFEADADTLVTLTRPTINDVVGSTPNIPAFLAGQPLCMRRRARDMSDRAPLCVIVDTAISAGISHETIRRRGAAILALVRLLSSRRALELWAGISMGTGEDSSWRYSSRSATGACHVYTRIDTAPLDLARAAFMLTHTAAPRVLGYGVAEMPPRGGNGRWPYNRNGALSEEHFRDVARVAFPYLQEFLAVPGLYLTDPLAKNPKQWIKDRLAEYHANASED